MMMMMMMIIIIIITIIITLGDARICEVEDTLPIPLNPELILVSMIIHLDNARF
jgi:flagellar biosynthesis component FlhA